MAKRSNSRTRLKPKASRPYMPGYGISKSARGMLPWPWAVERLEGSHNYWVSTTCRDGRPHSAAVWGVWVGDRFYFSSGTESLNMRNLGRDPRCAVTTERADEAVAVEGAASQLKDRALLRRIVAAYEAKYDWKVDESMGPFFEVRPQVAFGFIEAPEKFTSAATRWKFE